MTTNAALAVSLTVVTIANFILILVCESRVDRRWLDKPGAWDAAHNVLSEWKGICALTFVFAIIFAMGAAGPVTP